MFRAGARALSLSISSWMRASRSTRCCFSHALMDAPSILLRTALQVPVGGPGSVSISSDFSKPARTISSVPASPATPNSFALSAALLRFRLRNFGSSGFCSVFSSTFRAVRKKFSCTSQTSAAMRSSVASAAASSMGSGSGPDFLAGGAGAGASAGAAGAEGAACTPQSRRHAFRSKLFLMTSDRPSEETTCPVLPLRTTTLGMPRTPNIAPSICRCSVLKGTASQGCSP
mmetsp:Transcript_94253/g.243454  ORF Transcript_94253/g.243454 Transcript_94253/m.243454 type:complete len:230 (-) Transcript_94253:231-920(-)